MEETINQDIFKEWQKVEINWREYTIELVDWKFTTVSDSWIYYWEYRIFWDKAFKVWEEFDIKLIN